MNDISDDFGEIPNVTSTPSKVESEKKPSSINFTKLMVSNNFKPNLYNIDLNNNSAVIDASA